MNNIASEDELPVNFFTNFKTVINSNYKGCIIDIDDSTANVLFVISLDNGHQVLIPAVDNFISDIDIDNKIIEFNVPQDLLDL